MQRILSFWLNQYVTAKLMYDNFVSCYNLPFTMPKIMLNYRPNGQRHLQSTLKGLVEEVETGPSKTNS